jgi:hypothetical protein
LLTGSSQQLTPLEHTPLPVTQGELQCGTENLIAEQDHAIAAYLRWRHQQATPKTGAVDSKIRLPEFLPYAA